MRFKFSDEDALEIMERIKKGDTQREIAFSYGVRQPTISALMKRYGVRAKKLRWVGKKQRDSLNPQLT